MKELISTQVHTCFVKELISTQVHTCFVKELISTQVHTCFVKELISTQVHRAFRQTVEMFATNMKEDINSIRKTVEDLKCSLNFSQKDVDDIKFKGKLWSKKSLAQMKEREKCKK